MDFENTPYQKKKVEPKLNDLTDFLEDVQYKRGSKLSFKPSLVSEDKKKTSLDKFLSFMEDDEEINDNESEGVEVSPESSEDSNVVSGVYIAPRQRYFMGASEEPQLVIVSRVENDSVYYYTYPFKKEQSLSREVFADLVSIGSKQWLKTVGENASEDDDLYKSIKAVLSGNPGEKVSIEDYKFTNVQVKYTGNLSGDIEPWKELESRYNVNVGSNLKNKQTYNLRLTNHELDKFEDNLNETPSNERDFRIVKIVKEDIDFLTEAAKSNFKPEKRKISPIEVGSLKGWLQDNINSGLKFQDYESGQRVVYQKDQYIISDFIPHGDEKMFVSLIKPDFSELVEPVEINKIRPTNVVEITGKTKEEVEKTEKKKEVKFPEADEYGITKDQKALKEESVILTEASVMQLFRAINNDPDIVRGRFQVVVDNLKDKKQKGVYDSDLATQAFLDVVDRGARRYFGERYKYSANENLLNNVAKEFTKQFERSLDFKKEETEIDEAEVEKAIDEEMLPFTEKEVNYLKTIDGYEEEAENVISYTWDSGSVNFKVSIQKKGRPQTKDFVYTSTTIKNQDENQLDKERTIDSKPFKTEEDINILENFINELNLNENIQYTDVDEEEIEESTQASEDQKKNIIDIVTGKTGRDSDDWKGIVQDIQKVMRKPNMTGNEVSSLIDSLIESEE